MSDLAMPLVQSEAYERTCLKLGLDVRRESSAAGTCLIQSRKLPVIGAFHLISRGPVVQDRAQRDAFLRDIRKRVKGVLVVNAATAERPEGGLRLAAGADLALLDLITAEQMRARLHQKWRNQLKKAEASPLVVVDQPLDASRHHWFLTAETRQQKDRRYRNYPADFLLAFAAANKGAARLYTAQLEGEPVAAMLVLKHGHMATYQAGVTTPAGRLHCAHNLLLWRIMRDLQRRDVRVFDLGRADSSPGLKRFKLGSGARLQKLSGSFLFHHRLTPVRTSTFITASHSSTGAL